MDWEVMPKQPNDTHSRMGERPSSAGTGGRSCPVADRADYRHTGQLPGSRLPAVRETLSPGRPAAIRKPKNP